MRRLLQWHRYAGVIACLAVLAWGLSGVLHTLMMRLQPQAATFQPPPQTVSLKDAVPLPKLMARHRIAAIENVHVVSLGSRQYYQVVLPLRPQALYFETRNGERLRDGDRQYAILLARHYVGDQYSQVKNIHLLDKFDQDYAFINRLLPVYRVSFERPDGLGVYVETGGGRLGTITDSVKLVMGRCFQWLHTWSFLNAFPPLKLAMLVFLACGFLSAATGIYLYFRMPSRPLSGQPLRRAHRQLGFLVSLTTLAWTATGSCHLLHSFEKSPPKPDIKPLFKAGDFSEGALKHVQAASDVGLVKLNGQVFYRILRHPQQSAFQSLHAEHHPKNRKAEAMPVVEYVNARSGKLMPNADVPYAVFLASHYSGLPVSKIKSQTLVTGFNDEYGFIFKRLPVYRIAYDTPSRDVYFVEASTGKLAAHLAASDKTEGLTFATLHKWAFLGANLDLRDIAVTLFALGNALVALTGLLLFLKTSGTGQRFQ